jgi:hypothetical protein
VERNEVVPQIQQSQLSGYENHCHYTQMRGGTAGNFATHWMDKVANMNDTMDWKAFDDDLTGSFSMGNEKETAQWKIESFKQGNHHIADFIIKFHVLKTTSKTNDAHAISRRMSGRISLKLYWAIRHPLFPTLFQNGLRPSSRLGWDTK